MFPFIHIIACLFDTARKSLETFDSIQCIHCDFISDPEEVIIINCSAVLLISVLIHSVNYLLRFINDRLNSVLARHVVS